MPERAHLQPVRREHLAALSSGGPIAQHARGVIPDPLHGSCTDDVARALEVDLLHGAVLGWDAVARPAWTSLLYLGEAIDAGARARNFRAADGRWLDEVGSEDAHGRAVLSLGRATGAADRGLRDEARAILLRAVPAAVGLTAIRAQASALLGFEAAMRFGVTAGIPAAHRHLAESLAARFEPVAWSAEWPWPEPVITYESALPPRALIVAGRRIGDRRVTEMGLAVLAWLFRHSAARPGHLSPIGNGWWPRGGERSRFDQQPIEASSLLLAAEAALEATGDPRHAADMERAYAWFLGANDLGLVVADPARGGCHDGLLRDGLNPNEGAESTLAWLLALERTRLLRRKLSAAAA